VNESQTKQAKTDEELIEELADVQHEIWSYWMKHLFRVSHRNDDGSVTIYVADAERWKRQMATDYADLSEREKDSDRHQAHKVIAVLGEPLHAVDFPLVDLRTILDAILEWSQSPMEEYAAAVRVDGLLRQLEAQTEGSAA
jgi:hypothetical protein